MTEKKYYYFDAPSETVYTGNCVIPWCVPCAPSEEGVYTYKWFYPGTDADGDGHQAIGSCNSLWADDCNDNDATIYPGAPELCDGIDNDCNDIIDDECTAEEQPDDDSGCPPGEVCICR